MDFGDLFAGGEGGGIFEALFNLSGGLFKDGAIGDMLGGAARAGMENGNIFRGVMDLMVDAVNAQYVYERFFGRINFGHGHTTQDNAKGIKGVLDVIKSHHFINEQLEKYKDQPGIEEIRKEYKDLRMRLPGISKEDGNLLTRSYHALGKVLYNGRGINNPKTADEKLFIQLEEARKILSNENKRRLYATALHHNPKAVEAEYVRVGSEEFSKIYNAASAMASRKALTGEVPQLKGLNKLLQEMTPNQKTGLAFAVVTGAAFGTFAIAYAADQHSHKAFKRRLALEYGDGDSIHQERLQKRSEATQAATANTR